MAIDFPNSPSTNDQFTVGTTTWTYNGTAWVVSLGDASIATGAITADKIAANAVTTAKILDANITAGKIASDAVITAKILDANVTAAKLASGAAVTNIGYTPANIAGPTFTGTVVLPSTTSIGTVSSTEIGYVDGVTSAIQTQLDSKLTATTAITSNRNKIINGGMSVWQRGTSFADPANMTGYTADRWAAVWGTTGRTFSQQTGFANSQYCLRVQRNSGSTGTGLSGIAYIFETANSISLQGKTITLSFNARCGANFSATSNSIGVTTYSGTGTDQSGSTFYSPGWTGQVAVINSNATLSTTSQRFTFTGTVASNATQLAIYLNFVPTGTAGAADHFEITNVQLEEGAVATPFEQEDYGVTLSKCNRYYCTFQAVSQDVYATGNNYYGTMVYYPVPMRTTPTMTQTGSFIYNSNTSASTWTVDAVLQLQSASWVYFLASTTGRAYLFRPVQFSAEL